MCTYSLGLAASSPAPVRKKIFGSLTAPADPTWHAPEYLHLFLWAYPHNLTISNNKDLIARLWTNNAIACEATKGW